MVDVFRNGIPSLDRVFYVLDVSRFRIWLSVGVSYYYHLLPTAMVRGGRQKADLRIVGPLLHPPL